MVVRLCSVGDLRRKFWVWLHDMRVNLQYLLGWLHLQGTILGLEFADWSEW